MSLTGVYYFHVTPDGYDHNVITIVEKGYWEGHQSTFDGSLPPEVDDILEPHDIVECMDSSYATDLEPEAARNLLISLGFQENEEFSKFIKSWDCEELPS